MISSLPHLEAFSTRTVSIAKPLVIFRLFLRFSCCSFCMLRAQFMPLVSLLVIFEYQMNVFKYSTSSFDYLAHTYFANENLLVVSNISLSYIFD
jgi:hypothetical protein